MVTGRKRNGVGVPALMTIFLVSTHTVTACDLGNIEWRHFAIVSTSAFQQLAHELPATDELYGTATWKR